MDGVRLLNIVGHGPVGNVNENATLSVDGFVGPLQGVAGAWLHISGNNFTGDPLMRSCLPAPQSALAIFDADAHGLFPKFHCDFSTNVIRQPGPGKPFNIESVVDVKDAEGKMAAFPYPLRDFSCQLDIGEGILHVINGQMPHGAGTIGVSGIVRWKTNLSPPTNEPDGPNIEITGTNLPIDNDLSGALPPMQRQWVQNAGLTGNLDFAGRVFSTGNHKPIAYAFNATLKGGAIQTPDGSESAMSGLTAQLHLTPTRLLIDDLTGRRGPSAVTANAVLDWSSRPHIALSGAAKDLELSPSLFKMLPQPPATHGTPSSRRERSTPPSSFPKRSARPPTSSSSTSSRKIFPSPPSRSPIASIMCREISPSPPSRSPSAISPLTTANHSSRSPAPAISPGARIGSSISPPTR